MPIYFEENKDHKTFTVKIGDPGSEVSGRYNVPLSILGQELVIQRNEKFSKGDEVGYFFIINSRDLLLDYLLTNLTAEPLNFNANTVRISFKDHNAFKAQDILNKIDTLYLQYSNEQKNLANKQKIDWVSKELVTIESKMEGYENYFENFTLQNKTNNLDDIEKNRCLNQYPGLSKINYLKRQKSGRFNNKLKAENFLFAFLPATLHLQFPKIWISLEQKLSWATKTKVFQWNYIAVPQGNEVKVLKEKSFNSACCCKGAAMKIWRANKKKNG